MFRAEYRFYIYKENSHTRVAIVSDHDAYCSESGIVCYIKPRSRYESIDLTFNRAQALATLLNRGHECDSQS